MQPSACACPACRHGCVPQLSTHAFTGSPLSERRRVMKHSGRQACAHGFCVRFSVLVTSISIPGPRRIVRVISHKVMFVAGEPSCTLNTVVSNTPAVRPENFPGTESIHEAGHTHECVDSGHGCLQYDDPFHTGLVSLFAQFTSCWP